MISDESVQENLSSQKTQETASVGTSALWGTAAKGASVVANFLIGVIIARALGAEGKGSYTFIQQLVGILGVLLGFGLATSNVFFVASKRVPARTAGANTFFLATVTTLLSSIVLYLFLVGPFAPAQGYGISTVVLATALFFTTTLYSWIGAISIGLDGLRTQSKSSILTVILTAAACFLFWRSGILTVTSMLLIGVFTQAAGTVIVLLMEQGKAASLSPDLSALKSMIPYSFKSYIVDLVGYLHLRQDVLLLGWFTSMSSVGVYSIAVSFAEFVRYVPSILNAALFARISQPDDTGGSQISALFSRLMVLFVGVSALLFALLAPTFIPFVYGDAFSQSVRLFLLLLPGTICISLAESSSAYLFSREVIYWKLSGVVVALNIALNLALIPRFDVAGAAVASSVTYTLFSIGILWMAHKHSGLPLKDFLVPSREDVRALYVILKRILNSHKTRNAS